MPATAKVTTPHSLDLSDRSIHYGDGCFTTLQVRNGQLQLPSAHLQRLKHACKRLAIDFSDWGGLEKALWERASALAPTPRAVLKIIISRGAGGRGYCPQHAGPATLFISTSDYPAHYQRWQQQGITLGLSPVRLGRQPLLAGLKHLNRLEQVLVKQQMPTSVDDVLVLDSDGLLIEASAANVFWFKHNHWHTPALNQAGVEGVMRNQLISFLNAGGHNVVVGDYPIGALKGASAMLVCNSLMELVPVAKLAGVEGGAEFAIEPVHELAGAFTLWMARQ